MPTLPLVKYQLPSQAQLRLIRRLLEAAETVGGVLLHAHRYPPSGVVEHVQNFCGSWSQIFPPNPLDGYPSAYAIISNCAGFAREICYAMTGGEHLCPESWLPEIESWGVKQTRRAVIQGRPGPARVYLACDADPRHHRAAGASCARAQDVPVRRQYDAASSWARACGIAVPARRRGRAERLSNRFHPE